MRIGYPCLIDALEVNTHLGECLQFSRMSVPSSRICLTRKHKSFRVRSILISK